MHCQTTTRRIKTTLPRIGQLGTKIYHQTCVFDGWDGGRVKWWIFGPGAFDEFTLTRNAEGFGKRLSEHAGLTETFCWILSILCLGSGCGVGYQYDPQAFLFSLVNKPGWAPVKFGQRHGSSKSIYRCYSGPTFGGGRDLLISLRHNKCFTNLGYTYSPPSGYSYESTFTRSFLAGSYRFNPDEIETFYDVAFTSQGRFED